MLDKVRKVTALMWAQKLRIEIIFRHGAAIKLWEKRSDEMLGSDHNDQIDPISFSQTLDAGWPALQTPVPHQVVLGG